MGHHIVGCPQGLHGKHISHLNETSARCGPLWSGPVNLGTSGTRQAGTSSGSRRIPMLLTCSCKGRAAPFRSGWFLPVSLPPCSAPRPQEPPSIRRKETELHVTCVLITSHSKSLGDLPVVVCVCLCVCVSRCMPMTRAPNGHPPFLGASSGPCCPRSRTGSHSANHTQRTPWSIALKVTQRPH